jgi:hypothetical protein
MVEFASGHDIVAGVRALVANGVKRMDAFTPYEVHGLQEAIGVKRSWLAWLVLAGGLVGGCGAYALQWWINVVDYPLNIGGRPYHSAPAFIPITFEMGVLFAATTALISAIVLGGLPKLWHPVFDVDGFERATVDRFWLAIDDPAFDRERDGAALDHAGALRIIMPGGDT